MPPKTRAAARKTRRKDRKNVTHGHAYIKSTFNNTIVSLTDPQGAVIAWCSSGQVGFKGSRKSTPYAAQLAAEAAARRSRSRHRSAQRHHRRGLAPGAPRSPGATASPAGHGRGLPAMG